MEQNALVAALDGTLPFKGSTVEPSVNLQVIAPLLLQQIFSNFVSNTQNAFSNIWQFQVWRPHLEREVLGSSKLEESHTNPQEPQKLAVSRE